MSATPNPEAPSHRIFAGTSGWAYPAWKPGFYPPGVSAKKFLGYYASQLNSVEVNYTFRALPTQKQLEGWIAVVQPPAIQPSDARAQSPSFRFSFKAPQRITHFSRLVNCDVQVADLFAALAPASHAGALGLILFQLPPNFKADLPRLQSFLAAPVFRSLNVPPIAFEFRNQSWFTEEAYAILRDHNAALCIAETDDLNTPEIHTAAAHTCFRLRRAGGYSPEEIAAFAKRFRALAAERDVYVYFRHEDDPTGALNAQAFLRALESPA